MNPLNVSDRGHQRVHDCSSDLYLGDQKNGIDTINGKEIEGGNKFSKDE